MLGDIIYISNIVWKYGFQKNKDANGEYRHYGIDVGDNKVIHFLNYDYLGNLMNKVIISSRDEFSRGFKIKKCFKTSYKYSNNEIAQRAYNVLRNVIHVQNSFEDCENFVRYCVTNVKSKPNNFINDINRNRILNFIYMKK